LKHRPAQLLVVFVFAAALAGCGFKPMYSNDQGGGEVGVGLGQVKIAAPTNRTAQIVHNELLLLLEIGGRQDKKYRLVNKFDERLISLAIQLDDSVTRKNLILRYDFSLIENISGKQVFRGAGRSYAAYNLVQSDYANLIAEKDARERAAKEVAYQIRTRLATYFSGKK
jgi:LPS-assembly lipoprotein